MEQALCLAKLALGHSSPNPAVGAVIVKNGIIVGEGYTQPPGSAHAEVMALRQAGKEAKGGTMYVTLEPCCHWGRTPPCTQAITAADIGEIHLATLDPNPLVSGRGKTQLEEAGISTFLGEHEEQAREINQAYIKHITTGLPLVIAKFAMSLDGKIATPTGDSKWISNEESRGYVHCLRHNVDAVMVGVNTVIIDDPQLTARVGIEGGSPEKQPLRVIVDAKGRIPPTAQVFQAPGKALLAVAQGLAKAKVKEFASLGVEVVELAARDNLVDLTELLKVLGNREIISILAEGGGTLLGSLFERGLVDKVIAFIAPIIIGGREAKTPVEGRGVNRVAEALHLNQVEVTRFGEDVMITGYIKK
jgi:diaminohydroxyphosphoribosylaminopyrimidine deaminase/5-amino-6-(5-phosphoribosylamino)uracil reductase